MNHPIIEIESKDGVESRMYILFKEMKDTKKQQDFNSVFTTKKKFNLRLGWFDMNFKPVRPDVFLATSPAYVTHGMMKKCMEQDLSDIARNLGTSPTPLGSPGTVN